MITRILCAIDDTERSEAAAEFAIDLARQLSARLIFHMVNPAVLPSARGARVYLWEESYIRSYLGEALRRARRAGIVQVACETERAVSVVQSIVACADAHAVDLIVVGASGHGGIIDLFRRPVSKAVTDSANCPVLAVRRVRRKLPRAYNEAA